MLDAQGKADAILKVAEAQAEANQLINETLTKQLIQYTVVQELSEDIRVIVLPGGQDFILGEAVTGTGE